MKTATPTPISEVLETLKAEASRHFDFYVPYQHVAADRTDLGYTGHLSATTGDTATKLVLTPHAAPQLAERLKVDGKVTLPSGYVRSLMDAMSATDAEGLRTPRANRFADLLGINLEQWLRDHDADAHKDGSPKRLLFRMRSDAPLDRDDIMDPPTPDALAECRRAYVRALLSDSYLTLDHIPFVVTLHQVATGQYDFGDNPDLKGTENTAHGAQVFGWRLTPDRLDMGFMQPHFAFDLKNPHQGVFDNPAGGFKATGCTRTHGWMQADMSKDYGLRGTSGIDLSDSTRETHLVFPAGRASNSETGGGGIAIDQGFYEAWCNNACTIGETMRRTHLAAVLKVDTASEVVRRKKTESIMAEVAETIRAVFCRKTFEKQCNNFLGLWDIKVPQSKLSEIVTDAVGKAGVTGSVVDDILDSFEITLPDRGTTLGDVQRSITNAAQKVDPRHASDLEALGGTLVAEGTEALTRAGRELLAV